MHRARQPRRCHAVTPRLGRRESGTRRRGTAKIIRHHYAISPTSRGGAARGHCRRFARAHRAPPRLAMTPATRLRLPVRAPRHSPRARRAPDGRRLPRYFTPHFTPPLSLKAGPRHDTLAQGHAPATLLVRNEQMKTQYRSR